MLKKSITYKNFDDETVTEDFYFNMTKAELVELELSENGMAETLQAIVKAQDGAQIIAYFKKIILLSYGERSEDGRRFLKSKEMSDSFSHTEAYSNLFMELATDAKAASAFVNGIMPSDLMTEVAALPPTVSEVHNSLEEKPEEAPVNRPIEEMTRAELEEILRSKQQ